MKTFQSWNPELDELVGDQLMYEVYLLHGETTEDCIESNTWAVTHLSESPSANI
jgi:hypothetical protein